MNQIVLTPYSIINHNVRLQRTQLEQNQEKVEIVLKISNSNYRTVNAQLRTSNNKYIIDLNLNAQWIQLSQSDNILLDNQYTKESCAETVCAGKQNILVIHFRSNQSSTLTCYQQQSQSNRQRNWDLFKNLKIKDVIDCIREIESILCKTWIEKAVYQKRKKNMFRPPKQLIQNLVYQLDALEEFKLSSKIRTKYGV